MIEVFDNLLSTFQIDKLRKEALKQQNWVDGINTPYLKDIKLPQFTLPEIYLTPDLRNILFSLLNEIHIKILSSNIR